MIPDPKREPLLIASATPRKPAARTVAELLAAIAHARRRRQGRARRPA